MFFVVFGIVGAVFGGVFVFLDRIFVFIYRYDFGVFRGEVVFIFYYIWGVFLVGVFVVEGFCVVCGVVVFKSFFS